MKKLNGREMKALFVLSIVVPVSLLTTLRLTGVLSEPAIITETITLESIKWTFKRPQFEGPYGSVSILDVVGAFYNDSILTANQKIHILDYFNRPLEWSGPTIMMVVELNSTVISQNGFIKDVYVIFHKDRLSTLDWITSSFYFENLSLAERFTGYAQETKAYIRLTGANNSNSVYLSAIVDWSLLTPNNQTHQMEVAYELIYYNGTAYKKIIQPFRLKLLGIQI